MSAIIIQPNEYGVYAASEITLEQAQTLYAQHGGIIPLNQMNNGTVLYLGEFPNNIVLIVGGKLAV